MTHVGVGVCIKHLAATTNHTRVSAVATFLEMEGKLYKFKVEAFDTAGKIGEGEHTRAIIDRETIAEWRPKTDWWLTSEIHVALSEMWRRRRGSF